jgi:hypothetical protein
MGGGVYRSKKVIRVLASLATRSDRFTFKRAAKEGYKIKPTFTNEFSFPVGSNHRFVNRFIVYRYWRTP